MLARNTYLCILSKLLTHILLLILINDNYIAATQSAITPDPTFYILNIIFHHKTYFKHYKSFSLFLRMF